MNRTGEQALLTTSQASAARTGDFESRVEGRRRAIVFYVDKGSGFLSYLTWWLFAWRQLGLDGREESFDVILLTHPASVDKLPKVLAHCPEVCSCIFLMFSGVYSCTP